MSSGPRIYGDQESINRAKTAQPGDRTVYVNMDAILELPDEYEVVITNVEFDKDHPENSFTNVGTNDKPSWYPQTSLMYQIGEACGVSGLDAKSVPVIEEVDINPMLMKPIDAEPTFRRMKVGASVSKQSTRIMEDGVPRSSSICTSEENIYERCVALWISEEQDTEDYAKCDANGKFTMHRGKRQWDVWTKYRTPRDRRAHFASEMKHAHSKAETKAHCKTIRELAGLPTGFSTEDLATGKLTFSRVRRSREVLKAETAARLQAISNGRDGSIGMVQSTLFAGQIEAPKDVPDPIEDSPREVRDVFEVPEKTAAILNVSPRNRLNDTLTFYNAQNLIPESFMESATNIITWIEKDQNPENNTAVWAKALNALKEIEAAIPSEQLVAHGLYLR